MRKEISAAGIQEPKIHVAPGRIDIKASWDPKAPCLDVKASWDPEPPCLDVKAS